MNAVSNVLSRCIVVLFAAVLFSAFCIRCPCRSSRSQRYLDLVDASAVGGLRVAQLAVRDDAVLRRHEGVARDDDVGVLGAPYSQPSVLQAVLQVAEQQLQRHGWAAGAKRRSGAEQRERGERDLQRIVCQHTRVVARWMDGSLALAVICRRRGFRAGDSSVWRWPRECFTVVCRSEERGLQGRRAAAMSTALPALAHTHNEERKLHCTARREDNGETRSQHHAPPRRNTKETTCRQCDTANRKKQRADNTHTRFQVG